MKSHPNKFKNHRSDWRILSIWHPQGWLQAIWNQQRIRWSWPDEVRITI